MSPEPVDRGVGLTLSDDLVSLWPVTAEDHPYIFRWSVSTSNAARWRYHGQVPSPDSFVGGLYSDVHAHFTVRDAKGEHVGYVVAYAANLRSRHVHIGALFGEYAQQQQYGTRAMSLFVGYLFDVWDLLGIYAEVPEYTWNPIKEGSGGTLNTALPFEVVGQRPRFHYQNGRYWDDYICYLPVEKWRSRLD